MCIRDRLNSFNASYIKRKYNTETEYWTDEYMPEPELADPVNEAIDTYTLNLVQNDLLKQVVLNAVKGEMIMSQLVESLRRLYKSGQVNADYINARTSLTKTEKVYILFEEPVKEDDYETVSNSR